MYVCGELSMSWLFKLGQVILDGVFNAIEIKVLITTL